MSKFSENDIFKINNGLFCRICFCYMPDYDDIESGKKEIPGHARTCNRCKKEFKTEGGNNGDVSIL